MSNKFTWEIDNFDTEILGKKTVRIISIPECQNLSDYNLLVENLQAELESNGIEYVTARFLSNHAILSRSLQESGFFLIDALITFEIETNSFSARIDSKVKEAEKRDFEQVLNIAQGLYSNTRFFNDPVTEPFAEIIYTTWLKNSLEKKVAETVLIYEENGIEGFVTLKKEENGDYTLPLVGVSSRSQGKGIGRSLVLAAVEKLKFKTKKIVIETQIGNIPAQRTYLSCGFKPIASYLTFGKRI